MWNYLHINNWRNSNYKLTYPLTFFYYYLQGFEALQLKYIDYHMDNHVTYAHDALLKLSQQSPMSNAMWVLE